MDDVVDSGKETTLFDVRKELWLLIHRSNMSRRSSNAIFDSKFTQKSSLVKRTCLSVSTLRLTLESPAYM